MQQKLTKKQEEPFYTIEAILQQKSIQNQIYYLIKWEGYPIEESTWEPAYKIAETSELFGEYKRNVRKSGPDFFQSQHKNYVPPPIEQFNIIRKKTKMELISDIVEGINHIKDSTEQIASYSKILKDHYNPTELNHTQENQTQTDKMKASKVKQKKQPKQAEPLSQTPSKVIVIQPEPQKENICNQEVIQEYQQINQQQQSTSKKSQEDVVISVKEEEEPICQMPVSDFNKCGSFENGDQIDRVGQSVIVKETGQKRYFILWKRRAEGYYPKSSWVTGKDLLEKDPKAICRYIKGVLRL
ncbi:hypothetical protein pb186bvf_020492 [Paramecium bursaria]